MPDNNIGRGTGRVHRSSLYLGVKRVHTTADPRESRVTARSQACRVAPRDFSLGALSGSVLGDFHHTALPLMRLVVRAPDSDSDSGAWEGKAFE
jgi:hypothetical protein